MSTTNLTTTASDPVLEKPYRTYISRYRSTVAAGIAALFATNALDAIAPLMIGIVIDQIVSGKEFSVVGKTVALIIAVTLVLGVCRFLWRYFWGQFHHTVAEDLRNRLYSKFTSLGPSFFARQTTGGLMSLINNDVNSFRMAIGPGILVLLDSIFILIMVPILMWQIAPDWTWRCLILMPLVPFIVRWILKRTELAYQNQQARFAEMAGTTQEMVAGVRVIKSYAEEDHQTGLFNNYSRRYQEACNQVARVDASFGPALEIAAAAGSVILILICFQDVRSGAVTLGQLFAFYQYIQKMVWPMEGIGIAFSHFQVGNAAFRRIREQLSEPEDTPDIGTAEPKDIQHLKVQHLTFTYPGESRPTLKDISFDLQKGEVLGIVGATGSGKSTLAEVLCHLYPVPKKTIWLNEQPIENVRKSSLRSLLTMVPQDTFVFSRQIDENLIFGSNVMELGKPLAKEGASLVRMDEEIESWPQQYSTLIGERGINLSGGQRQRVTLARALIRKSPLVIIDDALSAVDGKTSANILTNLRQRLGEGSGCAAIIISHRLANVEWANRILVLNQGEVEAYGSHSELLDKSPTYRTLYQLQTSGAEA